MKSAIEQIEYYLPSYSENLNEMKIDNPEKVIDTIRNAVEQYFTEYFPMTEFFDEDEN